MFCAGFLVSDSWVVTLASCSIYNNTYVRAGSESYQSGGVISYIEETILHPDFDLGTFDSDIALYKLKTPLTGENIRPLVLPDPKNVSIASGDSFIIAGWGQTTAADITFSDVLQEINVPAVTKDDCRQVYGRLVTENMICGGGDEAKGPCGGDEGVPVLWKGQPVGLVCYIYHCARTGFPIIFTNIVNFVDWIHEVIET